jgi:hypothetical protein
MGGSLPTAPQVVSNGHRNHHPFADLRGLTVEALEQESTRLHETIADWTDGDGDQRRYHSIVARASEVNSRIAGHVVA